MQLSFHEGETRKIDGVDCVQVEPDIDYRKLADLSLPISESTN